MSNNRPEEWLQQILWEPYPYPFPLLIQGAAAQLSLCLRAFSGPYIQQLSHSHDGQEVKGNSPPLGVTFGCYQVVLVIKKKKKKNLPANGDTRRHKRHTGDTRDTGSVPRSGRFPWRRAWQPTPVVLPGESHGLFNPRQTVLGIYIPQYHCWK